MYISAYEDKLLFLDEEPLAASTNSVDDHYAPFFTHEDVARYERAFARRRRYLLQRLASKTTQLQATLLYTPMIDDFRRRLPENHHEIKLLDRSIVTIYEVTELLVIMQHTELLFQLLRREFASSDNFLWLAIEYILSHGLPYSHVAMVDQLKLLLQSISDWRDKIDRIFKLIAVCDRTVTSIDIGEALIFELMFEQRRILSETFAHRAFYRSVYDRSSRSLRYVLAHDFGRPLDENDQNRAPIITAFRRSNPHRSMLSLTELSFEQFYRYYEGRLLLRRYNLQLQYSIPQYRSQLYNYDVCIHSPTVSHITITEQYILPHRCFPESPSKFIYLCHTPDRYYVETALPIVSEDLL